MEKHANVHYSTTHPQAHTPIRPGEISRHGLCPHVEAIKIEKKGKINCSVRGCEVKIRKCRCQHSACQWLQEVR